MKVILKQEIKNLGREWDVVTVADGYARNYLLPRKLALAATQAGVKDLERRRQRAAVKRQEQEGSARILAGKIEAVPVVITARSGPEGRLYGSVTAGDIAEFLAAHGIEVDRRRVEIAAPIRTIGEHHVNIELMSDVIAHLKIQVHPEGGMPPAPPAAAAEAADVAPAGRESTADSKPPADSESPGVSG